MGGVAPPDSTANGDVTLVAGSLEDSGTVTILTKGTAETAEEFSLSQEGSLETIYSSGSAARVQGTTTTALPAELAATSQCPDFPLPLLVGALNNPDFSFQYIGAETVDGQSAYHVRFWNTYSSDSALSELSAFTARDIWLSASTALPLRLAWDRRAAGGSAPRIPMQVDYGKYTNMGGILYPFDIKKSKDGTPWITVTIQSVKFNTGLTDTDFPVE
jgi:hypothetical protein